MLLKELIDCAVESLDICGNTVMYAQGKLSISLQLNALLSGFTNKKLFLIIYCKN
jgi:hypothetical protein